MKSSEARKVIKSYHGVFCFQVFQCLIIEGENSGEDALREADKFVISDEDFEQFLERHKDVPCLVPESNQKVKLRPSFHKFILWLTGKVFDN